MFALERICPQVTTSLAYEWSNSPVTHMLLGFYFHKIVVELITWPNFETQWGFLNTQKVKYTSNFEIKNSNLLLHHFNKHIMQIYSEKGAVMRSILLTWQIFLMDQSLRCLERFVSTFVPEHFIQSDCFFQCGIWKMSQVCRWQSLNQSVFFSTALRRFCLGKPISTHSNRRVQNEMKKQWSQSNGGDI